MIPHDKGLLFHPDVRWLSREKIPARVLELQVHNEIILYEKHHALANCFKDVTWLAKFAYLSNVFMHLNEIEITLLWM